MNDVYIYKKLQNHENIIFYNYNKIKKNSKTSNLEE